MTSSDAEEPTLTSETPKEATGQAVAKGGTRTVATAEVRRAELSANCPIPDPYPEYCVTLTGFGEAHVMTGTHFGTIKMSNPELTVTLTHDCTVPGIPNLIIAFARKDP